MIALITLVISLSNFCMAIAQDHLTFVQISDCHIAFATKPTGKRQLYRSRELLTRAVEKINRMKVDFVVFTGDVINSATEKQLLEFCQIAEKLTAPWYVAIGNHDISIGGKLTKRKFYEILNAHNPYQQNSTPYQTFSPQAGYLGILMDGVIDTRDTSNGYFDKIQLNWLDQQLSEHQGTAVILFQHFPVVPPFYSRDHEIINAKDYLSLLSRHKNIVALLSGHYHLGRTLTKDGIMHISTPALVEPPNRFCVIEMTHTADTTIITTNLLSLD